MAKGYLEMIRDGIIEGDMELVRVAYEKMSGEKLPPSKERGNERASFSTQEEDERPQRRLERPNSKGEIKLSNVNLFVDKGKRGDKASSPLIKKPKNNGLYIKVKCNQCKRTFTVNKEVLPLSMNEDQRLETRKEYTCDECIGKRRR